MQIRVSLPVILLTVVILTAGCTHDLIQPAAPSPSSGLQLPGGRMSPDAIALEIAIAELEPDQIPDLDALWAEVDEGKLPLQTRRNLDRNGLRCAVVPVRTPAPLFRLVEPVEIDRDSLEPWQQELYDEGLVQPVPRMTMHKQIQIREGGHHSLQTSAVYPQTGWIVHSDENRTAGTGRNVRGVCRITTYPQGDGSVRIVVLPQIHHGIPRQKFGVRQSTFLFETAQSIASLDQLKIETTLTLGESLIVGATRGVSDLGGLFFAAPPDSNQESATGSPIAGQSVDLRTTPVELDPNGQMELPSLIPEPTGPPSQRILLIRLAQTQKNDLFDRRERKERLISTIPD